MTQSVTIRDVARQAGVSVATVSRVTSGSAKVSEDTRARVNAVLTSLGYEPSRLGQALALNRHDAFVLVLPGLGGAFFAGILNGFEDALAGTGLTFHVLVAQDAARFQDQIKDLATRVDGMCVFGSFEGDHVVSNIARRMPIVRIAGNPDPATESVNVNNFEAARDLTRHLIAVHGLRDLLFLGEWAHSPDVHDRFRGFQAALDEAGIPEARSEPCNFTQASALMAVRGLLGRGTLPQGIVCATDDVAIGTILACAAAGVNVPADLKVTGFDDIELARLITPALTTANQHFHSIGVTAAEILLRHARPMLPRPEHARPGHAVPGRLAATQEGELLPTELVFRQSCGC